MAKGSGSAGRGAGGGGRYGSMSADQLWAAQSARISAGKPASRAIAAAYNAAISASNAADDAARRARGDRSGGAVIGKVKRRGNRFS